MSQMRQRSASAVLAVTALALLISGCATATETGLPAVELEHVDGSGTFVGLVERDEPLVYNLWATWCAPCRAELPAFDAVASRRTSPEIIGINVGDSGDDAQELVDELDLSFRQLLDPEAAVQRALKITGMPATIFTDDNGEVLRVHNGELTEAELEELLDELYDV